MSFFLIVSYVIGLTNNLMPRCESEYAHQQHIVSIHINHFHGNTDCSSNSAHIGHEEHDDENSLINILQHFFDDIENPKDKCEFGFFASIHNNVYDVNSLVLVSVFKHPEFFIPMLDDSDDSFEYSTPNYSPPDQQSKQERGPPFFLV
ncbi:MAG TPA: hypothetical protein VFD77_03710 [Brumimicrobium sp.]|nr:hypothetical protein [Brumimicrobium sp.]